MAKIYMETNVLEEARKRVEYTFDNFERIYLSFSSGKDSTVMLHLVADEAKKRNRKFGVMIVDLEGQYKLTIDNIYNCIDMYKEYIDLYWVCLPISLRNAVSNYEPKWTCWDKDRKDDWIREPPKEGILDEEFFPFFYKNMEFEDFTPAFGEWYANGELTACLVGIRSDESLNRYRTIASRTKTKFKDKIWTTKCTDNVYNVYPIYDWRTEDIWTYHGKNRDKPYNHLYDLMNQAGISIHQARICQPYGDDQRRGLWLFHLIEPNTWAKIVARVSGANSGALYIMDNGNINGYRKVTKPQGHTWKSFAMLLLNSMPPRTKTHFENKIVLFERWWKGKGYEDGLPDEADINLEAKKLAPSWRRVVKSLLRNDFWCKGMGFSQHKTTAYNKYLELMERRKNDWDSRLVTERDIKLRDISYSSY